jgi:hypothetical protein
MKFKLGSVIATSWRSWVNNFAGIIVLSAVIYSPLILCGVLIAETDWGLEYTNDPAGYQLWVGRTLTTPIR